MKFSVLCLAGIFLVNTAALSAQQKESLETQVKKLQSRVDKLEKSVKNYSEMELRLKENSSATANLNTELNRIQVEVQSLNAEIQSRKQQPSAGAQPPAEGKPQEKVSPELTESIAVLENEVAFVRQELGKLQEARTVEKTLSNQPADEDNTGQADFRKAISSPWIGFIAFIISIIGLFT